jgi:hypothetical protein
MGDQSHTAGLGRYQLDDDWLNDAAKAFLPGDDPQASTLFESPGLSVRVASPRYLFVMKALAASEADEEDLRLLYPLCGFESSSDVLDAIASAYPGRLLKASTQYLVEALAETATFDHAVDLSRGSGLRRSGWGGRGL